MSPTELTVSIAGRLRHSLPDWAHEARQLDSLTAEERSAVRSRQLQANQSLAPFIGMASLIMVFYSVYIDVERYRAGQLNLGYDGRLYLTAVACHLAMAFSMLPALALLSPIAGRDRPWAARLLKLHLTWFISSTLLLGIVATIHHGRFLRLTSVLLVVNLLYVLPWQFRSTVNAITLALGTFSIFVLLPPSLVPRAVTFGEFLTLLALSSIGGAILHRDRVAGYVSQYRESLYLERLREEISVAAQLQQSLLPPSHSGNEAYSLQGMMRPAQDVGGDFYDHFLLRDGSVCLVIADVCGKGIPAGLFSMSAKMAINATSLGRGTESEAPDSARVVADVNNLLNEGNTDMLFVTAIYAHYTPSSGRFEFVNAGHIKPLLIGKNGTARWLEAPRGTALGARPNRSFTSAAVMLEPGDTVMLVTDGITEALNSNFEEFGADRIIEAQQALTCSGPLECITRLLDAVARFTDGVEQSDDITCIAVTHHPASPSQERA